MEVQLYSGLYEIVHLTLNLIPLCLLTRAECGIPWAPEVFLAYGGNFRCWPKAEATQKPETAREKSLAPKENARKGYRRSNNVSKQSNSANRHDTDDLEVA